MLTHCVIALRFSREQRHEPVVAILARQVERRPAVGRLRIEARAVIHPGIARTTTALDENLILLSWLAALDEFRNWVIREAAETSPFSADSPGFTSREAWRSADS